MLAPRWQTVALRKHKPNPRKEWIRARNKSIASKVGFDDDGNLVFEPRINEAYNSFLDIYRGTPYLSRSSCNIIPCRSQGSDLPAVLDD